ncbi:Photosynthesis system II assembly factor YCF48 [Fodinibius salinus]|uniref:Photosynthesis system II assembly factor YCF48 n=1 Tax=Fodinibius salinus TaxID=860790 RepID=A0A5D3YET5_9BACT|nr:YCF48-related protein [Fodinibius salinus]TYP91977.1 Photosynthesis system II assembly factor YCF48 [Fodinibius salinus]
MKRLSLLISVVLISLSLAFTACNTTNSDGEDGTPDPVPPSEAQNGEWTLVTSSVDNTIHDVVITPEGAYAVAEGGILLERTQEEWIKVVDSGVSGNGNNLFGLAKTADENKLWMVGSSGAVGEYNISTGNLNDFSQPMDASNNFNDVAVTRKPDATNIYIAGDSGQMYYNFDDGKEGKWNSVTPGNGSAINAVGFFNDREGHIIDANQSVFVTQDGGTWNQAGIADADVDFEGIDSDGTKNVRVSGGNGMIFTWNGSEWMSTSVAEATLMDIEVDAEDQSGYAVGGGATIISYNGSTWSPQETPTTENINAVALGSDTQPDIAVGAGGTILER